MAVLVIGCLWTLRRPLVGICLNMIFFPLNPVHFGTGLETIRFQFIATICLGVSYLLHCSSFPAPRTNHSRPLVVLWLYCGWALVVSTWAQYSGVLSREGILEFAKLLLFVWLFTRIVRSEGDLRAVAWTVFISFGLKAFWDRWGAAWGFGSASGQSVGSLGASLVLWLPSMLYVMASTKRKWELLVGVALLPFMLDFVVLLDQRSSFASLVVAGAIAPVVAPRGMRKKIWIGIGAAALVFVMFLANPQFWERMSTILEPSADASAASRFTLNAASRAMVREFPLGVGWDNYRYVSRRYLGTMAEYRLGTAPHNSFYAVLTENGWPGLVLWALAMGWTWLRLARLSLKLPHGSLGAVLARGLAVGALAIAPSMWTHSENQTDCLYWVVGFGIILHHMCTESAEQTETPK